jgi:hypothetical protein
MVYVCFLLWAIKPIWNAAMHLAFPTRQDSDPETEDSKPVFRSGGDDEPSSANNAPGHILCLMPGEVDGDPSPASTEQKDPEGTEDARQSLAAKLADEARNPMDKGRKFVHEFMTDRVTGAAVGELQAAAGSIAAVGEPTGASGGAASSLDARPANAAAAAFLERQRGLNQVSQKELQSLQEAQLAAETSLRETEAQKAALGQVWLRGDAWMSNFLELAQKELADLRASSKDRDVPPPVKAASRPAAQSSGVPKQAAAAATAAVAATAAAAAVAVAAATEPNAAAAEEPSATAAASHLTGPVPPVAPPRVQRVVLQGVPLLRPSAQSEQGNNRTFSNPDPTSWAPPMANATSRAPSMTNAVSSVPPRTKANPSQPVSQATTSAPSSGPKADSARSTWIPRNPAPTFKPKADTAQPTWVFRSSAPSSKPKAARDAPSLLVPK